MPDSAENHDRQTWLVISGLVSLSGACAALLTMTYLLAVRTTRGRLLDGASFRGAANTRSSLTGNIERLLDAVSVTSLAGAAVLITMIALFRLRRGLALAALAVLIGSNVTSQMLKRFVLPRPRFSFYETTPATLNSMPSGHSTVAFSVAVALVLVLPTRMRAPAAWLGVVCATAAAVATLSAGWHRPSDSVAAFLVVGCWTFASGAVLVAKSGRGLPGAEPRGTDAHRDTPRRLAMTATGLLAFGGLIAAVVLLSHLDTYGTSAQVLAYLAGGALIAGVGTAIMAALLASMHRIAPRHTAASPTPGPSAIG